MKIVLAFTYVEASNRELSHEHLDKSDELSDPNGLKDIVSSSTRLIYEDGIWSNLSRLAIVMSILSFLFSAIEATVRLL